MNNYPSTNFATVFFLVILFIGTGLLIYHTYEVTFENNQLKEDLGTFQASVTTLNSENIALKSENNTLNTKNAELNAENIMLTDENSALKFALEIAVGENLAMKASDSDKLTELEKLRRENSDLTFENQRLMTVYTNGNVNSKANLEVLESSFVPTDIKFWVMVIAIILIGVVFFTAFAVFALIKKINQKWTPALYRVIDKRETNRRSQNPQIITSHFADR